MLKKLPVDVIINILKQVGVEDVLQVSTTCHKLYRVSQFDIIWHHLLERDYNKKSKLPKKKYQKIHTRCIWVSGSFGETKKPTYRIFTPIHVGINIRKVSCGWYHVIMEDFSGGMWGLGSNNYHQVSPEEESIFNHPVKLVIENTKDFSCGRYCTAVVDNTRNLRIFGKNKVIVKILKLTSNVMKNPVIMYEKLVSSVKCQHDSIYVTFMDGIIFRIGFENLFGNEEDNIGQISKNKNSVIIVRKDGTVVSKGYNKYGETGFPLRTNNLLNVTTQYRQIPNVNAKSVSRGENHTMFIDDQNYLLVCGLNNKGQLGLGSNKCLYIPRRINNIKMNKVACMDNFSVALSLDGFVYVMGENDHYQLGQQHSKSVYDMVKIKSIEASNIYVMKKTVVVLGSKRTT